MDKHHGTAVPIASDVEQLDRGYAAKKIAGLPLTPVRTHAKDDQLVRRVLGDHLLRGSGSGRGWFGEGLEPLSWPWAPIEGPRDSPRHSDHE